MEISCRFIAIDEHLASTDRHCDERFASAYAVWMDNAVTGQSFTRTRGAVRQVAPPAGLPEISYPLHDKDILVTACGRICMHRKKINISTVMAGQRLGIK